MFEASGIPLIFLDVICIILVGLPFFILTPKHDPFKRGFFCNDESIRYPLKEETIPYQLLGGVMIPFTLIVLICGEFMSVYLSRIKNRPLGKKYLLCIYKTLGSCVFGATASQSLTDITKYSIGRLRPHFLAVCKPVWAQINCKTGEYVENFTCTGDEFEVAEARLSFSSGHSSFSMYCMLFLVLYLQARMRSKWTRLLRPLLQFFLTATAIYVGLTRVSDYKHHWSDVVAGLLQGGSVAVFTVFCVSNFFSQPVEPVVSQEEEASHTSLQDNPSNGNHYGSTE
ncbi:PREDICTED: lipid phosphate phosphohydrolase 1-like [Cyprinodon variegatus]|uniref:Phospholipid phosphatase 1 n=1 Tax=Cyprinodon variegatus TaxID=28743 RepID=A0A3Q2DDS3_CYPVA|nr:PREDICTED: lipid phosphate phosphohydrolase 1-like [Cyprinodon variegatus]XP_015232590.1 PREDICTED: lipid phosphate phosphohydrolase 1-like [Cyprinodon variegatus]